MKRVLIVYFSHSGETEKSAGYIAEGIRFTGTEAVVKPIADIRTSADLNGYDGYIFGSPTYNLDIPAPVKSFLKTAGQAVLKGKLAGAFGTYRHEVGYAPGGEAAAKILETMEKDFGMMRFELGAFKLKEDVVEETEGMRASQDYGKVFGEKLGH
jgi:flavodoxin